MAVLSCEEEWGYAIVVDLIDVSPVAYKALGHSHVAVVGCDEKWATSIVSGPVFVCPLL